MAGLTQEKYSALVLAGGRSRRMGRDKALLPWNGHPLLARAAMTLGMVDGVREVVVACGEEERAAEYAFALRPFHFPVAVVFTPDDKPGLGPLGGLATGLAACRFPLVVTAPVDCPRLVPDVATRLLETVDGHEGAVVRREGDLEPLHAAYRREVAPKMRAALDRGERAAHRAIADLDVAVLDAESLKDLDPEGHHFDDVDGPEDLR